MEPSQTIGQRIKLVRGELSQKAFGVRIGLSQTAVTALENDQSEPRLGTFNSIIDAFNINPEWLRTGQGSMARHMGTMLADAMRPLMPAAQLPPAVPSKLEEAPGTLRINREGEDGNYWKQIAEERADTIELLKQLLTPQFPGLADAPGKSAHGEYAAVALSPEVGFQQAGRRPAPVMFVASSGHRLAWVDEVLDQPLTVEHYLLKKTA